MSQKSTSQAWTLGWNTGRERQWNLSHMCLGFSLLLRDCMHGSCHAREGFYSWSLTCSGMSRKWQQLESSDGKAHWQVLHVSTCQELPACWLFPGKKKILVRVGHCCSKLCSLVQTPKGPHCKHQHSMHLDFGMEYDCCVQVVFATQRTLVALAISYYVEVRELQRIAKSLEY